MTAYTRVGTKKVPENMGEEAHNYVLILKNTLLFLCLHLASILLQSFLTAKMKCFEILQALF